MSVQVSFLLVSGFQMAAYVLATDALRLANWRDGQPHFHCDVRTPDDRPAEASNGMVVAPDAMLGAASSPDAVFVCAGFSPEQGCSKSVFRWLRELDRRGAVLGGWDTGPLILAEAGLMTGRQMALHWQAVPAVRERYPHIDITSDRCQIEKRRFTGPGGVTTLDLILAYIAQAIGARVAQLVAESANRTAVTIEVRHNPSSAYLFPGLLLPKLARVIATMEQEIETPSPIPSIAQRSGLSERALYRAFREQLGVSPRTYYLNLRLERQGAASPIGSLPCGDRHHDRLPFAVALLAGLQKALWRAAQPHTQAPALAPRWRRAFGQ